MPVNTIHNKRNINILKQVKSKTSSTSVRCMMPTLCVCVVSFKSSLPVFRLEVKVKTKDSDRES